MKFHTLLKTSQINKIVSVPNDPFFQIPEFFQLREGDRNKAL